MSNLEERVSRLEEQVTRINAQLGATMEIVAAEVVGLRTHIDERFDSIERRLADLPVAVGEELDKRFATVDTKLDEILRRLP